MTKEKTIFFCMNLIQDRIDRERALITRLDDESAIHISEIYISVLNEHLCNLEDLRLRGKLDE